MVLHFPTAFARRTLLKTASLLISALTLGACSGNPQPPPQKRVDVEASASLVKGPISHHLVEAAFLTSDAETATKSSALQQGSSVQQKSQALEEDAPCGKTMKQTALGLKVASKVLSFLPVAGSAMKVLKFGELAGLSLGAIGGSKKSNCTSAKFDAINEVLASHTVQIQQIQSYLGLATNELYVKWFENEVENAQTSAYLWSELNLAKLSPSSGNGAGMFGSFMMGTRLWSQVGVAVPGVEPEALALDDAAFANAWVQASAGSASFQGYVNQFSGTRVAVACTTDCYKTVDQYPNSALINLYGDLFRALQARIDVSVPQVQAFNQLPNQNVVPLYDQYNVMLINFYQRSALGLQQAFTMEWIVNELNYFRAAAKQQSGATGLYNQIPSFGGVAGTWYSYENLVVDGVQPSGQAQADAYNAAQRQLALLYAARFNQLYLNTINHVVSDVPVAPQAYPTTPVSVTVDGVTYTASTSIDYASEVGKNLPRDTGGTEQGATPLSLLPAVAAGEWKSAAVLYQFSGLTDIATCVRSLVDYNESLNASGLEGTLQEALEAPGACPAIFTTVDGKALNEGFYDGNTLAPYTSFQVGTKTTGGPMVKTGIMRNNLKFCEPTSPNLGWHAPTGTMVGNAAGLVAGAAYLNCGNWYTPDTTLENASCRHFHRAQCPANSVAGSYSFFQDEFNPAWMSARFNGAGSCNGKYTKGADSYVGLLNLFERTDYPAAYKTLGAVIYKDAPYSPFLDYARLFADGTTEYIGWIGSGFAGDSINANPDSRSQAFLGLRLWNPTNAGYSGSGPDRGWVLPLGFTAQCEDIAGNTGTNQLSLKFRVKNRGTMDRDGYECVEGLKIRCTFLDGSQFDLAWEQRTTLEESTWLVIKHVAP